MPEEAGNSGMRAVSEVRQSGFLRLKFPKELEAEYRHSRSDTDRRWARMSLIVALSTVLGFAVIDHWVLPGPQIGHADLVRFGLQLPMVLTMLVLTDERYFDRFYQTCIQVAAPLFGLGTVVMATQASPEQLPLISARIVLAAFFFYFMLALSLSAALRVNAVLMGAYAIVAITGVINPHVATYQLWTLFCANLIGACGCYALERANRMAFLDRRRLADVAMHDGLTGLLNRAALEEQVRKLYLQAARDQLAVSVVLIDIDHFKAYNDRYGHQAGDQCLREVASAVRRAARRRPLDLVARYGGEELIAVLFGADRAHAEATARAVLDSVRELRIPHAASLTRPYLTASVGAATLAAGSDYSHDLAVQMADRALYAAKAEGRDGWSYFDETAPAAPHAQPADPLLKTAS
jgi:diguanylate cyclase (GGDEF)-like protein